MTGITVSWCRVTRNGSPASAAPVSHSPRPSPTARTLSTSTWLARSSVTTPAAVHSACSASRPAGAGTASRSASARSTSPASGVESSAFVSPVTASARAGSSTAGSSAPAGSRSSTAVAWASSSPCPLRTSRVRVPSLVTSSTQARCQVAAARRLRRAPSSASWNRRISVARSAAGSRTGPVRDSTAARSPDAMPARRSAASTSGNGMLSEVPCPVEWPSRRPAALRCAAVAPTRVTVPSTGSPRSRRTRMRSISQLSSGTPSTRRNSCGSLTQGSAVWLAISSLVLAVLAVPGPPVPSCLFSLCARGPVCNAGDAGLARRLGWAGEVSPGAGRGRAAGRSPRRGG